MITGTPALSRPCELFNICQILYPSIFTSFKEYGLRYCDPKPCYFGSKGLDYKGSTHDQELKCVLAQFMIRRLKEDVMGSLPDKIRSKVGVKVEEKM